MATIHLHETTTSTPEQFIAALTDFGPGRSQLFGNSADEYLKVHDRGATNADVTEGSGGVWERLHYDWSDPNHVVMKTTDSNMWGGDSGHVYNFTRNPDGTTDLADGTPLSSSSRGFRNGAKSLEIRPETTVTSGGFPALRNEADEHAGIPPSLHRHGEGIDGERRRTGSRSPCPSIFGITGGIRWTR